MRECDSSSKAANLTRRFGSSAPGFWREPFASSATTSPSPPETQLQPKWGYKCSGGDFRRSGVTSDYQALQIEFQRHMSHGLQALAAYTWSHSIDYGSNDAANPLIRGNSDFDVRHNFSGGVSWDLPSTPGNKVIGNLLDHW